MQAVHWDLPLSDCLERDFLAFKINSVVEFPLFGLSGSNIFRFQGRDSDDVILRRLEASEL